MQPVGAFAEPEQVTFGRSTSGIEGSPEPGVLPRAMVRDEIDEDTELEVVRFGNQRIGVGQRAEVGVDVAIVGDVVAAVEQRRGIPRADPDGVDAELGKIRQPRPNAVEIADAIPVRVGERAWVDLVDDCATPPLGRLRHSKSTITGA